MFVIQEGRVQVFREAGGREIPMAELGVGRFFGEMSLFEKDRRSSTVRAMGSATILTVDQHTLLNQITANPTLALHMIREMAGRIRKLNRKHARVLKDDRRNWETRPEVWDEEV
jgi:CRP-like cAMP-binding protein